MAFCRSIFTVFVLLAIASQAHAMCAPFPKSDYLGNFTHTQVATYVDKAHGGDWTPYLVALNNNLTQLEQLQRAGKGAVLKIGGKSRMASPNDISKFVYVSKQWLSVAECLAEEQTMAALGDFTTAAGGSSETAPEQSAAQSVKKPAAQSAAPVETAETMTTNTSIVSLDNEVASLNVKPINVKITALCESGVTVFRVTNTGGEWPDNGVFSMFRMGGAKRELISARRMRLEAGEAKTFRISKKQNLTGEVGFSIDPSWYKREFKIDADAQCR